MEVVALEHGDGRRHPVEVALVDRSPARLEPRPGKGEADHVEPRALDERGVLLVEGGVTDPVLEERIAVEAAEQHRAPHLVDDPAAPGLQPLEAGRGRAVSGGDGNAEGVDRDIRPGQAGEGEEQG